MEISGEIGIHGGDPIFMGWRLAHCRVISSHIKAVGMKCAGSRYGVGCKQKRRGIMGVVRLSQPQNIFLFSEIRKNKSLVDPMAHQVVFRVRLKQRDCFFVLHFALEVWI